MEPQSFVCEKSPLFCSVVGTVAAGVFTPERVYGEVGDLAAGRLPGRKQDDEITIADLTGVGVQDAAIAATVVESLGL